MNKRALESLRNFCAATQVTTQIDTPLVQSLASQLLEIPALHNIIQYETKHTGIQIDTLGICRWLYIRGATVLRTLCLYPAPLKEIPANEAEPESKWQQVFFETKLVYGDILRFDRKYRLVLATECPKFATDLSTQISNTKI